MAVNYKETFLRHLCLHDSNVPQIALYACFKLRQNKNTQVCLSSVKLKGMRRKEREEIGTVTAKIWQAILHSLGICQSVLSAFQC